MQLNNNSSQCICGLIIAGMLPITQFEQINNMLVYDLYNPSVVSSITFFLNSALPDNIAAVLNYSIPPYNHLQFIGAIANTRPSDIFSTKFGLNPDVNSLDSQQIPLKLVIQMDSIQNIRSLVEIASQQDLNKFYAKKVAQNLYNFMMSYQQDNNINNRQNTNMLVVPDNFLDQWYKKFEIKYSRDPNFIMNTQFE